MLDRAEEQDENLRKDKEYVSPEARPDLQWRHAAGPESFCLLDQRS